MAQTFRVLMMGTGRFAVPTFRGLLESDHEIVGLVTQPDRVARGGRKHRNPMKELAEEFNLPVFQPENINTDGGKQRLAEFNADLAVVAAYGQILSAEVINTPRLGCINVHASLLPKYRGAAPIQHAIIQGETETGVTVFQIEPKLDAGMILGVESTAIGEDELYGELEERLSALAPRLLVRVVDQLRDGTVEPQPQDASLVTKARSFKKSFGQIDWAKSMHLVHCHIRGTQPWPRPFSYLHRPGHKTARLLVLAATPREPKPGEPGSPGDAKLIDGALCVSCSDGWLPITTIQPEGKRPMGIESFLRGNPIPEGSYFGREEGRTA